MHSAAWNEVVKMSAKARCQRTPPGSCCLPGAHLEIIYGGRSCQCGLSCTSALEWTFQRLEMQNDDTKTQNGSKDLPTANHPQRHASIIANILTETKTSDMKTWHDAFTSCQDFSTLEAASVSKLLLKIVFCSEYWQRVLCLPASFLF